MRKKSFVIILLISFWLGYTLLSLAQTIYASVQVKDRIEKNRNREIDFILQSSEDYLMSDNLDLLKRQLYNAVNLRFIDFYCLKKITNEEQEIIADQSRFPEKSACDDLKKVDISKSKTIVSYPNVTVSVLTIDDYVLVVAYGRDLLSFIWAEHKENLIPFLKDILIITIFVGILIYLILKDFVIIDQLLKKGDRDKLSELMATSKEAQTLIESTMTLDYINANQKQNINILQNTVGAALASEIYEKTESLTNIPVSVVRIDLNGYTQIFLEKKEEHIVSVLNEYFEVTNDIIKRYQGEIYQIIGDEVIFLFKDNKYLEKRNSSDGLDHKLKALFSVKAIFQWAEELDRQVQEQYGHRFLLKASISNGNLKFVKLNTGYAFAGVPLIESVRLLGSVSDKTENTLIVTENDYKDFQNFFPISNQKLAHLKGFEDRVTVFEIKEFSALDEYFVKTLNSENEELLRFKMQYLDYFKGQEDIHEALVLINKYFQANQLKPVFYLIQTLKKVTLSVPDKFIAQRLYQILSDHFQTIQSRSLEYSFLPGLVLLTKSLVHKDLWSEPWNQLLQSFLLSNNPRVVANASDVYYFFHDKIDEIKNILTNWEDNNRISALFILAKMKREITKKESEVVVSWLKSENPLFQASALYLVEELLKFYFSKDEVIYKTNEALQKLRGEGLKLKSSYNQMVQSRAQLLQQSINTMESEWGKIQAS